MLLSDIFSIPFLMCLAICILLIGCSSIYFYQRIQQQDHKISSMVSLISSMAEDTHPITSTLPVHTGGGNNIIIDIKPTHDNRIPVSDDEDSESDSGSEYSTTSSEEEDDICEILSEMEDIDCSEDIQLEELEEDLQLISAVSLEEEKESIEEKEEEQMDDKIHVEETRSIHLEQPTDFSIFKTISVIGEETPDDVNNYKKMSLPKLRELAQLNGHGDTSKLKKQEILKLLGVE